MWSRWGGAALAAVLIPCAYHPAHPATLAAQEAPGPVWHTRAAHFDLDLRGGDGEARVRARYDLEAVATAVSGGGDGGTDSEAPPDVIALRLLGFGGATAALIEVERVGGVERLPLDPLHGTQRAGDLTLEPGVEGALRDFVARYRVDGAVTEEGEAEARVRIPLLTGPPVHAEAGGAAFSLRVRVPAGWALRETFPATLRPSGEGEYEATLTVVPAVVTFRARTDGRWRPGFPLLIDVMTVLILGAFAGFGWRHLRSVAR